MPAYVNPASLRDEPLRLKRTADADYSVMVRDVRAGRIFASMAPGMVMMWAWTITGPCESRSNNASLKRPIGSAAPE